MRSPNNTPHVDERWCNSGLTRRTPAGLYKAVQALLVLMVAASPSGPLRADSLPLPSSTDPEVTPETAPSDGEAVDASTPLRGHPQWRLSASLVTYSVSTVINEEVSLGHFFLLGGLDVVASLDTYWEVGVSLRGGGALAGDATETVAGVLLDGRYIIDRMTWIPWISFGVGGLYRSRGTLAYLGEPGAGDQLDFSVHAGLGLDYDAGDGWRIGAVARYHLLLTDDLSRVVGPIEFSVHGTYTFP